ncbi:MAG: signal peptidase II [Bdellovibrionales bacterium]|nr:signal peptidase II [Bdellovibrionales bacterium]
MLTKKHTCFGLVSIILIILDQVTKLYIHTHYRLGETNPIINNFFNLSYVQNKGAAFGILSQGNSPLRDWFFLFLAPCAALFILFLLKRAKNASWTYTIALSFIFSGTLGNYLDRIQFGYVIDFLDVHYKSLYYWPVFNIADAVIVIGVSVLIFIPEPK